MRLSTRALLGLTLQSLSIILIPASPISPANNGLCIQESDLQNIRNIVGQYKKEYGALDSTVQQLTNQQQENTSTANQNGTSNPLSNRNEDDKILSTWMDLFQLNVHVQNLFDNYTIWLEKSTRPRNIAIQKDTQENQTELKTVIFSLWLQLQKSNKRINKLEHQLQDNTEEGSTGQNENTSAGAKFKTKENEHSDKTNRISEFDGPSKLSETTAKLDNTKVNDIHTKLNKEKAPITFSNDLHNLQGQINALNATVVSLVAKMTKLEKQTSSLRILDSAETYLDDKADQRQFITNETCNGSRRHLVGSSCYFIPLVYESEQMSSWWDARYFCKQPEVLGPQGDLAVIDSKQEMDAIHKMLTNHFGGIEAFWIGASDIDKEGDWIWAPTETSLSNGATFWAENPRKDTLTNCAAMEEGYRWIPEPCYYERVPLCEVQL